MLVREPAVGADSTDLRWQARGNDNGPRRAHLGGSALANAFQNLRVCSASMNSRSARASAFVAMFLRFSWVNPESTAAISSGSRVVNKIAALFLCNRSCAAEAAGP